MSEQVQGAPPPAESTNLAALDEAGFQSLYASRILPCFEAHEGERVAAVSTFRQRLRIGLPIVAAIAIALLLMAQQAGWGIAAGVFGALGVFVWANSDVEKVRRKVKTASLTAIADSIGVTYTLMVPAGPAFDRCMALSLLPGHDRKKFEDWFAGAHAGANFDLYEAHLERRHRDNKGRTHWSTVFRGQIVRLKFPRDFLGVTVVRRDAGIFNGLLGGRNLQRIGLEDPKFEKAFEVFGTDQVEARYLLHPVFMERLLALETAFRGKKIRCAFEQGDLLIAIEGGNRFEPGSMFKPLADEARAHALVDDLGSVMRVIDAVVTAQTRRN